jgi:hypothetical protein
MITRGGAGAGTRRHVSYQAMNGKRSYIYWWGDLEAMVEAMWVETQV